METTPIIDYGRTPRRKWRRYALALLLAAAVVTAWYVYAPVWRVLADKYAAWQFRRAFDRAAAALVADSDFRAGSESDTSDEAFLTQLASKAGPPSSGNLGPSSRRVLFTLKWKPADGNPRLTFVCMTLTGLEHYSFNRSNRAGGVYDRPYATRAFWGYGSYKNGSLKLEIVDVRQTPAGARTVLKINGGRNVIDWTIPRATTAPVGRTRWILPIATPLTGWKSNQDWWPDQGDVEQLAGTRVPTPLPTIGDARAITFGPGGNLVLASTTRLALLDPRSGSLTCHQIPDPRRDTEIVAFSPDGQYCFLGGTSTSATIMNTTTGTVHALGGTAGMARPDFADNNTLMLLDNTRIRRINCTTGDEQDVKLPSPFVNAASFAGELMAYTSVSFRDVRLTGPERAATGKFENIQGLHQMSLSPDGRWLALKGQSGLRLFDTGTGERIWDHDMDSDLHTARSRIKFSADGMRGTAAGTQYVYVWSMARPRRVARFPHGFTSGWVDAAISPDGRSIIASAATSTTVAYWPDIDAIFRSE